MPFLTLALLPVASLLAGAVALYCVAVDDMDTAGRAALHMVAYSLANIACWFVL